MNIRLITMILGASISLHEASAQTTGQNEKAARIPSAAVATRPADPAAATTQPADASKSNAVATTTAETDSAAANANGADESVINLEQQYDVVASQKTDGRHDLYKYPDGTRVILVMKLGQPTGVDVVDKKGRPVHVVAVKRKLPCVFKPSPYNPGFTVGCGRKIHTAFAPTNANISNGDVPKPPASPKFRPVFSKGGKPPVSKKEGPDASYPLHLPADP